MGMTLNELNIFVTAFKKRRDDDSTADDRRTARICCIIANSHSKKKFKEKDFMPRKRGQGLTPDQFATALKAITLSCGGEING